MSTMMLSADVHATFVSVVRKFPHSGSDDDRRAAMEKAVQTVRAKHGLRYVWKTEHQNLSSPSKDGMGFVPESEGTILHGKRMRMFIWDMINGTTREPSPAHDSETLREAFVLTPEAKDWLAEDRPPGPADLSVLKAELTALKEQLVTVTERLKRVEQTQDELGRRMKELEA